MKHYVSSILTQMGPGYSIDGYSRTIVYLQCSDNNKATTLFTCFRDAVLQYGPPSRVCSDRGGENMCVADYMQTHPQ